MYIEWFSSANNSPFACWCSRWATWWQDMKGKLFHSSANELQSHLHDVVVVPSSRREVVVGDGGIGQTSNGSDVNWKSNDSLGIDRGRNELKWRFNVLVQCWDYFINAIKDVSRRDKLNSLSNFHWNVSALGSGRERGLDFAFNFGWSWNERHQNDNEETPDWAVKVGFHFWLFILILPIWGSHHPAIIVPCRNPNCNFLLPFSILRCNLWHNSKTRAGVYRGLLLYWTNETRWSSSSAPRLRPSPPLLISII